MNWERIRIYFQEQKAKHYLDNFGLGWLTVFYDIPRSLAGYLQDLFSVTIATKQYFIELEPTISFFWWAGRGQRSVVPYVFYFCMLNLCRRLVRNNAREK